MEKVELPNLQKNKTVHLELLGEYYEMKQMKN